MIGFRSGSLGGDDTVNGGDGNDTIIGGAGNDGYNGGAGTDLISYAWTTQGVYDSPHRI